MKEPRSIDSIARRDVEPCLLNEARLTENETLLRTEVSFFPFCVWTTEMMQILVLVCLETRTCSVSFLIVAFHVSSTLTSREVSFETLPGVVSPVFVVLNISSTLTSLSKPSFL